MFSERETNPSDQESSANSHQAQMSSCNHVVDTHVLPVRPQGLLGDHFLSGLLMLFLSCDFIVFSSVLACSFLSNFHFSGTSFPHPLVLP